MNDRDPKTYPIFPVWSCSPLKIWWCKKFSSRLIIGVLGMFERRKCCHWYKSRKTTLWYTRCELTWPISFHTNELYSIRHIGFPSAKKINPHSGIKKMTTENIVWNFIERLNGVDVNSVQLHPLIHFLFQKSHKWRKVIFYKLSFQKFVLFWNQLSFHWIK